MNGDIVCDNCKTVIAQLRVPGEAVSVNHTCPSLMSTVITPAHSPCIFEMQVSQLSKEDALVGENKTLREHNAALRKEIAILHNAAAAKAEEIATLKAKIKVLDGRLQP
jgi:hypothetical protein